MKTTIHLIAGVMATLTIAMFFTSTIVMELFGGHAAIAYVKRLIVFPGLCVLVPAIAITGGTGFALSKSITGPLVEAKKKRMPIITANGLVILVPAAIVLDRWAAAGTFDATFYAVQLVELAAGAPNLVLMALNARDGFRVTGRLRPSQPIHVGGDDVTREGM